MPQSGGMRMNWFRYVKFRARVLGGLGTVLAAVPLSLIALGAAPSSAAGADWSSYLHDNGHSSYNAAATSITPATLGNLQPVWRWLVPPSPNGGTTQLLASPTVYNGTVYIGAKDGYFYAVNETTQSVEWSDFLGLSPPHGDCGPGYKGLIATATVATDPSTGNTVVYENSPDGYVYAMDAATGSILWKGLVDTPSTTQNDYYSWSSPLVANGKVYVGISSDCDNPLVPGGLVSFDQATGATVAHWNDLPNGVVGGSIWSSPLAAPDGDIIVTTGNGTAKTGEPLYDESIVALDPNTLQVLDSWQVPSSQQSTDGDFGASPTLFSANLNGTTTDMVGACNKNGLYYAFRLDDLSAGPVWSTRIAAAFNGSNEFCDGAAAWNGQYLIEGGGGPITINGTTYMGSVQALDPATGVPIWQTGLTGTILGSVAWNGGGVVSAPTYQSSNGQLGVYLLNATTGAVVNFVPTPKSPLFGQAVFAGSDLLVPAGPGLGLTTYEITTPGPPITGVSPSTIARSSTDTVTLTGSGFSGSPKVFVSGDGVSVHKVSVLSSTQIQVKVSVGANATLSGRNISVIEPGSPDIADTCSDCLTVGTLTPPAPTGISPSSLPQGVSKANVSMSGSGFVSGAKVTSNAGITIAATFVSSTQLNLAVSVASTEAPGSYNLTVTNPDGSNGQCAGCLTITPGPQPGSITPSSLAAGTVKASVTMSGTGFQSGATVSSHAGITVKATFVSSGQLNLTISVSSTEAPGSYNLFVKNPDGGVGECAGCLQVT